MMENLAYVMALAGVFATAGSIMRLIDWLDRPKSGKKNPHSCGNSHADRRVTG